MITTQAERDLILTYPDLSHNTKQKCQECGHIANVQIPCKLWACAVCTLIQPVKTKGSK